MPAGHRTIFRPKQAELARACWMQDATLLRLQMLAADSPALSEFPNGIAITLAEIAEIRAQAEPPPVESGRVARLTP